MSIEDYHDMSEPYDYELAGEESVANRRAMNEKEAAKAYELSAAKIRNTNPKPKPKVDTKPSDWPDALLELIPDDRLTLLIAVRYFTIHATHMTRDNPRYEKMLERLCASMKDEKD